MKSSIAYKNIATLALSTLWLYLFIPFRIFDYPSYFLQIEEWSISFFLIITIFILFTLSSYYKSFIYNLTIFDFILCIYLIYIIFHIDHNLNNDTYLIKICTLIFLYIVIRVLSFKKTLILLPCLTVTLAIQFLYNIYTINEFNNVFNSSGSIFNNAGLWGGFIGIVLIFTYTQLFSKDYIVFSLLFLSLSYLLYNSNSRASLIAVIAGVLYYSFIKIQELCNHKTFIRAKYILLILSPLIFFIGKLMYNLKPTSANGRYYIWKISSELITDSPWCGIGVEKFKTQYMHLQANYLSKHPNSPFSYIADDVSTPFCEPLKIIIEQGTVGLLLISSAILTLYIPCFRRKDIRSEEKDIYNLYKTILITLLLFSCFSYPFMYIQFNFIFVATLAILARSQYRLCLNFPIKRDIIYFCISFSIAFFMIKAINKLSYTHKWHKCIKYFDPNKIKEISQQYANLYCELKEDPHFLISYAYILMHNKRYHKAIEILEQSLLYQPSYTIYIELGNCYERIGSFDAIDKWKIASNMIPSKFEPIYLQIKNYHYRRQYLKADSMTDLFTNKKVKIESIRLQRMKSKVKQWQKERANYQANQKIQITGKQSIKPP